MAIPFRDSNALEKVGLAAYLRFVNEPDGKGVRGALFCVNSRGEPAEFTFSRIDAPPSLLWRAGDARRYVVVALSKTLFAGCSGNPTVLLALAEEVPPRVFAEDLEIQLPFCRIAAGPEAIVHASDETLERLGEATHLFWSRPMPGPESEARLIVDALNQRNLLLEPFERAAAGLEEAFRKV